MVLNAIFAYFPIMNNLGKFKEIFIDKFLLYHPSLNKSLQSYKLP